MKILVKTRGRKSRTVVHAYDEGTDSALCRAWPKPGAQWEIREVDDFMAIPWGNRCAHCTAKLTPKPPKPSAPPTAREQRRQRDLAKLAAWNAQAI